MLRQVRRQWRIVWIVLDILGLRLAVPYKWNIELLLTKHVGNIISAFTMKWVGWVLSGMSQN